MGLFNPTGKRVYNWYISLVAASCMVLYGYDASVFNALQNSDNWVEYFNDPGDQVIGAINTAYVVGAIVAGFFFAGPVADYFGRRVGMMSGAVFVIVATFMQTFAPRGNLACFIVGRVLIGIGQGLALTAGSIYIGELAPQSIRGMIMSFWQMFYSVGSFIALWIKFGTSKHVENLGEWDWKMVVIFQAMVPLFIVIQVPFLPETPRWYIQHGKIEQARKSLARVRDTEQEIEDEALMIREAIEFEKEAISSNYSALWKDKSIRHRLILALILNAGQQITGQGSLNSYSSIIYQKIFTRKSQIDLINALNATFGIIFTANATWTVDRFGRKFLTSEVFSMNVRAQAVGMASQTQNVANLIVQQFFPTFLNNCGFYAFYMFAGINFLLATFVYFFVPETKKVLLEEMDDKFGGVNHVEKGGDLMGVEDARHADHGKLELRGSVSKGPQTEQKEVAG
ncbi:general substrate transporter [Hortaea werneckii]|nr:general substrate transporter [Hortaea werneckii]